MCIFQLFNNFDPNNREYSLYIGNNILIIDQIFVIQYISIIVNIFNDSYS